MLRIDYFINDPVRMKNKEEYLTHLHFYEAQCAPIAGAVYSPPQIRLQGSMSSLGYIPESRGLMLLLAYFYVLEINIYPAHHRGSGHWETKVNFVFLIQQILAFGKDFEPFCRPKSTSQAPQHKVLLRGGGI